jgi:hypothetical protein
MSAGSRLSGDVVEFLHFWTLPPFSERFGDIRGAHLKCSAILLPKMESANFPLPI